MPTHTEGLNLVVGEDFEIYICYEDDQGNLYDFAGYDTRVTGRCSSVAEGTLFDYVNTSYAETGTFTLLDNDDVPKDFNLKIVIPSDQTSSVFSGNNSTYFHIGVVVTSPANTPFHLVVNEKVMVTRPIAR